MTTREWIKQALPRSIERNGEDPLPTRQLKRELAEIELNDLLQNPSDELQRYQVSFPHQQQDKCPIELQESDVYGRPDVDHLFHLPHPEHRPGLSNGETLPGGWGLTIGMLLFSSLACRSKVAFRSNNNCARSGEIR